MQRLTWKNCRTTAILCFIFTLLFGIMSSSFCQDDDEIPIFIFLIVIALVSLITGIAFLVATINLLDREDESQVKPFENPVPLFMDSTFSDDEEDFLTCGDDELHERFLRLKTLYEDDLITEEEYEQKKKELLEEL